MDQRRSRIVIAIFVGAALLISITTIVGTWRNLDELPPIPAETAAP